MQPKRKIRKKQNKGSYRQKNRTVGNRGPRSRISNGGYDIGQVKTAPIQQRCIRYECSGGLGDYTFSVDDLLNLFTFCTSTYVGYSLISSARLQRVKISMMPESDVITPQYLTFNWEGLNAPNQEETMSAMTAVPATGNFYVPENSNAAWWHSDFTSTEALFSLNSTSGSDYFMDLEIEWIMEPDGTSNVMAYSNSANINTVVYPSLPITGTNKFAPVNLPTG